MSQLTSTQIKNELTNLPEWQESCGAIIRDFTLANFREALRFINEIGERAEAADHHPDLLLHDYRRVKVTLTTHSAGGLTVNDFALARQIDALFRQFNRA